MNHLATRGQVFSSVESFWTEARVTELREHFDKGLSNNQIAHEMGIRSRNAVIGKLHRLGLTRGSGGGSKQSQAADGIVRRVRAPKPKPPPAPRRPTVARVQADTNFDADYIEEGADGAADVAIADICRNRVALMSAGKDECRWPAADDGSAVMVCGDPVRIGSYCQLHAWRSFRRPVASQRGMPAG